MTETFVYSGVKELIYVPSKNQSLVHNRINTKRPVLINGQPLPSLLIQEEDSSDNWKVYDWGTQCNRNLGMNLAASILDYHYKRIVIPYEMVYIFYKEVVRELTGMWLITQNEIDPFMSKVYYKFTGEVI